MKKRLTPEQVALLLLLAMEKHHADLNCWRISCKKLCIIAGISVRNLDQILDAIQEELFNRGYDLIDRVGFIEIHKISLPAKVGKLTPADVEKYTPYLNDEKFWQELRQKFSDENIKLMNDED